MTTRDKSREAFEAKYAMQFQHPESVLHGRDEFGDYRSAITRTAYSMWQAAEAYGRKVALEEAIAVVNKARNEGGLPLTNLLTRLKELIK